MLSGILAGLSLNSHAAITDDPAGKNTKDGTAQEEQLTVYGRPIVQKPGSATVIGSEDMQKHGGNDFGTLMRYQPLIGATGSSSGSGAGKSGFDRAATPAITFAAWKATASASRSTAFRCRMPPAAAMWAAPGWIPSASAAII